MTVLDRASEGFVVLGCHQLRLDASYPTSFLLCANGMVVVDDFPERPPTTCLSVGWSDGFFQLGETVGSTFGGPDVSEWVVVPAETI